MKLVDKQLLRELHKPGWAAFWLALVYGVAFFGRYWAALAGQ